jgi:hypothetical protein
MGFRVLVDCRALRDDALCAAAHTFDPVSLTLGSVKDVMAFEEFQVELRRNARFESREPLRDALDVAVQNIRDNPAFAQSRLLGRVVRALTNGSGEFRRAEASAFDAPTLRLVVALMNAAVDGSHTRAEWLRAAAATESAANG